MFPALTGGVIKSLQGKSLLKFRRWLPFRPLPGIISQNAHESIIVFGTVVSPAGCAHTRFRDMPVKCVNGMVEFLKIDVLQMTAQNDNPNI